MTAVSGDLLTTRNATIDDLVVLLRDQQARKVDVVALRLVGPGRGRVPGARRDDAGARRRTG